MVVNGDTNNSGGWRRILGLAAGLASLELLAGCGQHRPAEHGAVAPAVAEPLARVGDQVVREADYQALMEQRANGDPNRFRQLADKEALLEEMVNRTAVYAQARAAGFEQRPEIQAAIQRLVVEKYQADQLNKLCPEKPVGEPELREYYQAHLDRWSLPAQAHGAAICLRVPATATAEQRAAARARTEALLAEVQRGPDSAFAALAQRSEDQATRYRGGDFGWVAANGPAFDGEPAVTTALFQLGQAGELAPVVAGQHGFYLVKLLDRRPAAARDFPSVRAEVEFRLRQEQRGLREQAFYAQMKSGLKIERNRARLETLTLPPNLPDANPPALPGLVAPQ